MATVAIRDRVRVNMPETYDILQGLINDSKYPDIFGIAVAETLSRFFPTTSEDGEDSLGLTDFQVGFLGDWSTRLSIPAAIDFYMVKTGRSDAFSSVAVDQDARSQRTSGPGTGRQNYDRVAALQQLDDRLAARIAANADDFSGSFQQMATAGIMISTTPDMLKTPSPLTMPRYGESPSHTRNPPYSWPDWPDQDTTEWPP